MKRVVKIKIYPNRSQIHKIQYILSGNNFVWNAYLGYVNRNGYIKWKKYSNLFNKYKKGKELPDNDDYYKSDDYQRFTKYRIYSKAFQDTMHRFSDSFKKFMKNPKNVGRPEFKSYKKGNGFTSYFFIKETIHFDTDNDNIIMLSILGRVRIQHKDRKDLPNKDSITSGRIIKDGNKYYAMFIYDKEPEEVSVWYTKPLGIDLGIRTYATVTNGINHFKINGIINDKVKLLEKKVLKLERIISLKAETTLNNLLVEYKLIYDKEPNEVTLNIMKGLSYRSNEIHKLKLKMKRLHRKITNIKRDNINKLVHLLTKFNPKYIAIEDLSVKDMISNFKKQAEITNPHKFHKMIQERCFYYFRERLVFKCKDLRIKVHLVDRKFPSTKKCNLCGNKKKVKLADRYYICDNPECCNYGLKIDRDVNAALNILETSKYEVI